MCLTDCVSSYSFKVTQRQQNEFVIKLSEQEISINEIEELDETEIIDLFDINADF